MKVTVCFGNVRVVVPCGEGNILVQDLIREAILRYKKATGKSSSSWVMVMNLQTEGGGILDPDDRLRDVLDDREQVLASYEDAGGRYHHTGGDGASGSGSQGTGSPDIFHDGDKYSSAYQQRGTDIEVTGEQLACGGSGLQVRRGSEPALHDSNAPTPSSVSGDSSNRQAKRWSAAPLILEPSSLSGDRESHLGDGIQRDAGNRLSMQFLGDGTSYRWAEAAERAASGAWQHSSASLPRELKRKEPLGQANTVSLTPANQSTDVRGSVAERESGSVVSIVLAGSWAGPLGIHVVPFYDGRGDEQGLLVQGIEPGGRVYQDGRLALQDRIIEINGHSLINMPFQRVQEIFQLSLTSPELRLKVIKNSDVDNSRTFPLRKSSFPKLPEDKENVSMFECEQKQSTTTKVATVSPTKKVPAISKNLKSLLIGNTRKIGRKIQIEMTRGPNGLGFSIASRDNPAGGNCPIYIKSIMPKGAAIEDGRLKIGDRLLEVNGVDMTDKNQAQAVAVLKQSPLGSKVRIVVSRQEEVLDNANLFQSNTEIPVPREREIGGDSRTENSNGQLESPPSIPPLPHGHLQAMQARTPEKESVAKIIHRFESTNLSRSDKRNSRSEETMIFPWKHREVMTLDIPVHDSEKAGLGISVKGKTSGAQDLGIFIKSVINGGAASRDGRLQTNDQLLNVNGISLLMQSNSEAMETLRKAMLHTEGPVPGNITLTVARRLPSPISRGTSNHSSDSNLLDHSTGSETFLTTSTESESSKKDNTSGTSSESTNTVIYNQHPSLERRSSHGTTPTAVPPPTAQSMGTWNPVLDRLLAFNNKLQHQQLRNESYLRATHDTWTTSMLNGSHIGSGGNVTTTLVNGSSDEPILIEDDYGCSRSIPGAVTANTNRMTVRLPVKQAAPSVPVIVPVIPPGGPTSVAGSKISLSSGGGGTGGSDTSSATTVVYDSQLSLETGGSGATGGGGFARDALGRQSMSEKRHAALDAKNTDTYQRTKRLREERIKSRETNLVRMGSVESIVSLNRSPEHQELADKLGQLGPSLGMKKSSSLESLQTMVQEIQMKEEADPAYSYRGVAGGPRVIRGRGCEESLRAAVRGPVEDPDHRSEVTARKHWLLDAPQEVGVEGPFANTRGARRQSSLNAALDAKGAKGGKKKQGILKGIGSMFRFGKHRKIELVAEDQQIYHQIDTFTTDSNPPQSHEPSPVGPSNTETIQTHPRVPSTQQQDQQSQDAARKEDENRQEQSLPQPHHRQRSLDSCSGSKHDRQPPLERQRDQQQAGSGRQQEPQHQPRQRSLDGGTSQQERRGRDREQGGSGKEGSKGREQERDHGHYQHHQQHQQREPIYQLHGYIQRHAEQVQVIPENASIPHGKSRTGSTTSQDSQRRAEHRRDLEQRLAKRHTYYHPSSEAPRDAVNHRPSNHRTSNRSGPGGDYGRPGSRYCITDQPPFSHYVNCNDIQNNISRKQYQYHSQRQTKPDTQLRPVSNFYEYESVQSLLNNRTNVHHHHQGSVDLNQDVNSNSLPRASPQGHVPPSRGLRGPFVTHVTIGQDHAQPKGGTKV